MSGSVWVGEGVRVGVIVLVCGSGSEDGIVEEKVKKGYE